MADHTTDSGNNGKYVLILKSLTARAKQIGFTFAKSQIALPGIADPGPLKATRPIFRNRESTEPKATPQVPSSMIPKGAEHHFHTTEFNGQHYHRYGVNSPANAAAHVLRNIPKDYRHVESRSWPDAHSITVAHSNGDVHHLTFTHRGIVKSADRAIPIEEIITAAIGE